MPEGMLTFSACDAYRYIAGQAMLMRSQSRSSTEYLLPMDDIIQGGAKNGYPVLFGG